MPLCQFGRSMLSINHEVLCSKKSKGPYCGASYRGSLPGQLGQAVVSRDTMVCNRRAKSSKAVSFALATTEVNIVSADDFFACIVGVGSSAACGCRGKRCEHREQQ